VDGRKRVVIVDTQGNLLIVKVVPADTPERQTLRGVVTPELVKRFPRLKKLLGDQGFEGMKVEQWVKEETGLKLEIVKHPEAGRRVLWAKEGESPTVPESGFRVLRHRWIVERTFGWLNRQRRFSKDYEFQTQTSETMLLLAMGRRQIRNLAHGFSNESTV
jgi:putative transposase